MMEYVLLVLGIIFLVLGKISLDKFEKKQAQEKQNIGAYFQLNTHLLVGGFLLVIVAILSLCFGS